MRSTFFLKAKKFLGLQNEDVLLVLEKNSNIC